MKVIVLLLLCTFVFAHRHHGGADDQDENVKQCRLCVAEADGEYQWCPHSPTTHNDYDGKCIKFDESCPTTFELPIYTPSQCAGDKVELKTSCSECLGDGYTWCADDLNDDLSGSCVAIDSIVVPDRRRHGVDSSTGHHFNGGGGWPRGGHQKHEGEGDAEGKGNNKNGNRRRPHSVDGDLPDVPPTPVTPVTPGLPPRPSPPRHDRDEDQSEDGEGSSGESDSSDSSEDGDWNDHDDRDAHEDDHGRGRPPRGVFPPRPGFPEHPRPGFPDPEHPEPGHPNPFPDHHNRDGWRRHRRGGRDSDGSTGSDEPHPDHGSEEEGRGEREGQHRRGGWWRHGSTGTTDGGRRGPGRRHHHDGDRDHDRDGERDPGVPPVVPTPVVPVPVPVPVPTPSEPTPVVIAPFEDSTGVADNSADNSATGPLIVGSDSSAPSIPAYQASTGSGTGSGNTKRGMCMKRGQQLVGRLDQCPGVIRKGVHPVRDHDDSRHHDHEHHGGRRNLLIWVVIPVTLFMCCAVCCIRRRCRRIRALRASQCTNAASRAAAAEGTIENNNNGNGSNDGNGNGSNDGSNDGNGNLCNNGNNNGSNNSVTVNLPSVTTINVSRPVYAVSPSHLSSSLLRQPLIQSAPEDIPSEDQGAQEEQQQQEMALALESEGQLPTELGDDGLAMPSEAVLMLDDAVINSSEMEGEVEERKPGFLSRLLGKVKRSPYQPVQ